MLWYLAPECLQHVISSPISCKVGPTMIRLVSLFLKDRDVPIVGVPKWYLLWLHVTNCNAVCILTSFYQNRHYIYQQFELKQQIRWMGPHGPMCILWLGCRWSFKLRSYFSQFVVGVIQECAQIIYTKKTKNKKTTSEWIDHGLLQFACQSEQDTEPQVSPSPLTCACDK